VGSRAVLDIAVDSSVQISNIFVFIISFKLIIFALLIKIAFTKKLRADLVQGYKTVRLPVLFL
jgi:hypothetical protein